MDSTPVEHKSAPTFSFVGFIHEGVPCAVANLPACVKFYTEVFGLKLLPRPKALDDMGIPGAWLGDEHDRVQFHLIAKDDELRPGEGAKVAPAGRHTAWRIADVEAFRGRMHALGIPFDEIGSLVGKPQLFVVDPEGHTWEFQGP
jgi:catechol 2,3-dioxygenase-like lactoylglutathione lyase family enzyme